MATAVASSTVKVRAGLSGRKYDHVFFSGMAVLLLGSVFLGFAHSYYLAGMFHAPLPSAIIHVHGALFSSWILFLLAQTTLVACRASGYSPAHWNSWFLTGVLDGDRWSVGGYEFVGAERWSSGHRRKNVLYHPDDRHADFLRCWYFLRTGRGLIPRRTNASS